ncbi:MAG TPA: site-specific DNA-methyltransferase, partial [Ktedonobacterales bacterium]
YQYVEAGTGRRYMKVPVHAPGTRNGETGKPWRGVLPPQGKHWQYPPATLDAMDARGEIYWSPTGNPRRKVYLDESQGIPVQDIWLDLRDAHNQNIKISGYPTEKNADLLARIIRASSNEGDIVLDCFSGSGTALVEAAHLNRRWIGIDNSAEAIGTTLRRFATGLERMGDYVPAQRKKRRTTLEPLPLFPMMEHDGEESAASQHNAITNFSLYASEPYDDDLDKPLARWQAWQPVLCPE